MSMMGDWEPAISIIDALNVVGSDGVNDIVQFVQSLLVFINAELDDDQIELLKKNKMFSLISSKELNADVKYIAQQVDAASVQFLTEWLEGMFDTVVGIPDRKSRGGGGGDTGEAVKLRDGWGDLEIVARNKEPYVSKGERETLKFAISTLMTYNLINDLKIYDVEIKYSRNKSDNLLVKTQSYSNLVSTKTMTPEDSMNVCDFTNDSKETAGKGKAYWDEEADKVMEQENTKLGLQAELTRAASETTGDENNENNGNQKD
jgi:SPP1 family phage portal protein